VGTEKQSLGGTKTLLGDEVYSPTGCVLTPPSLCYWPLAVYSGRGNNPHGGVRFEAKPGSGGIMARSMIGRSEQRRWSAGQQRPERRRESKAGTQDLVNNVNSVSTTDTVDFVPTSRPEHGRHLDR